MSNKPTFEVFAEATIERARATFEQRGVEYADDWKEVRPLTLRAVSSKLGFSIPQEYERAVMWAVLCDLKYQRRMGGYKDDTMIDSINYDAVLAEEMQRLMKTEAIKTALKKPVKMYSCLVCLDEGCANCSATSPQPSESKSSSLDSQAPASGICSICLKRLVHPE